MVTASQPIRRSDLMSWAKVAMIVIPIIASIIATAVKLSVDAADLRRDVAELQVRVGEHERLLRDTAAVGPKLAEISGQLSALVKSDTEARQRFVALEARLDAQNKATERFWATTWPTLESRLGRIETLLDRRK